MKSNGRIVSWEQDRPATGSIGLIDTLGLALGAPLIKK